MTLPGSNISMSQVAGELGISASGLSLNHSWVRQLAGAGATGPVSFSGLLGQTAQPTWFGTPSSDGTVMGMSVPFFRGTAVSVNAPVNVLNPISVGFSVAPSWSGNIVLKNTTTNASVLLTKQNSTTWSGNGVVMRGGITDGYVLSPSN